MGRLSRLSGMHVFHILQQLQGQLPRRRFVLTVHYSQIYRSPKPVMRMRFDGRTGQAVEATMGRTRVQEEVSWMAWCRVRKRGQCIAYISCTRSTLSLTFSGAARRIATWMRRITSTPSSVSTSPVTSAVNLPLPASIWRASSAPPNVPIIQPAVAAMT